MANYLFFNFVIFIDKNKIKSVNHEMRLASPPDISGIQKSRAGADLRKVLIVKRT